MNTLPTFITNCNLWQTTLAQRENDSNETERERFRSTFITFRERCGHLANEIRRDLPDLTVHDLSHLDALWEIASIIVGGDYVLTPSEAFVLGAAILLHDLGMSIAATDGGFAKIKTDPRWADLITFEYQTAQGRQPTSTEIDDPESRFRKKALFNLLRQIHAENAERLAKLSYQSSDATPIYLIEDTEIRQTFGRLIGQIAHSHWWSITQVENELSQVVGAPHWCPRDWTINPLKLACILRTADAAHLDGRRAPAFLKAMSNLSTASEEHWTFQERLNKPYLGEDALVFTSGHAFRLSEASAWWLCLDTLRMTDRELWQVDALFAEREYPRFAAKRIAGVDTPERLRSFIPTDGWLPINAMVHVTDLPGIIHSIGGEELYGKRPDVAVRELIQNACDAIRARRMYEDRSEDFGKIKVTLSVPKPDEYWLEVADNGIGMSQRVLTDFLLDFGRTFWGSPQMQEEFPGLLSSGIKPIGKYGIGFFAVFMVAEQVLVATQRSDAAVKDTHVLEFSSGLKGRPILRPANKEEWLRDGGTRIRLKLNTNPYAKGGLLFTWETPRKSLAELCQKMCPALDVDLYTVEKGIESQVVSANDWQTMRGEVLLERMNISLPDLEEDVDKDELDTFRRKGASNLRQIINPDGEIIGRAFITAGWGNPPLDTKIDLGGIVTVGGLTSCRLSGICGILVGRPARASRVVAIPIVSDAALKTWAEEQADLVPDLWSNPEHQAACAQYIRLCGGETKGLPIAKHNGKWISSEEIAKMTDMPDEVILIDHMTMDYKLKMLDSYILDTNVFVTRVSGIPGLLQAPHDVNWPRGQHTSFVFGGAKPAITLGGAVIEAIWNAWGISYEDVAITQSLNWEVDVKIDIVDGRAIRERALRVSKPVPPAPTTS